MIGVSTAGYPCWSPVFSTLDNTVDNNITKHLLAGQSLKLIVAQYHTITQTFNAGGGNMNIVKSASRLSNAFITL